MLKTLLIITMGACSIAHAGLVRADFLTANDGLLVNDSVTGLQWLTPVYSRGHVYNDAFVQNINNTYGFRYATAAETIALINNNFGNPVSVHPGNAAGFTSAAQFFALFGVAEQVGCDVGPCPRTQGLTSTPGTSGTHLGFGMIQYGTNGYAIMNNNWGDTFSDQQMGSFLVRINSTANVPEPATYATLGLALTGLALLRRRRPV